MEHGGDSVSKAGSRFALMMLVASILVGALLTGMSAVQLVQTHRFSRQLLNVRARNVAGGVIMRSVRHGGGNRDGTTPGLEDLPESVAAYVQIYDPEEGLVDGTRRGREPDPPPREVMRRMCDERFARMEEKAKWNKNGTVRVRMKALDHLLEPDLAGMDHGRGGPVFDAMFALPRPPEILHADEFPPRAKKGLVLHRKALDAGAPCQIVRVGVDASAQVRATRSHMLILILALASTVLVLLVNGALYRALRAREREARMIQQARRIHSLGRMAATLAHELKNPVGAIRGYAQLMREARDVTEMGGEDAERIDRAVETIVRESTRLEELVQRTLEYARPGEFELVETDMRRVADAAADLLTGKAGERGVSIITDHDGDPAPARLDPDRMEQVVANLLDNAIEASGEGDHVVVRVGRKGSDVVCEVADRGRGIAKDRLESIFEPFSTDRPDGTGLGLAVSRSIVEAHRGRIEVRSEGEGEGAVFRVVLPA